MGETPRVDFTSALMIEESSSENKRKRDGAEDDPVAQDIKKTAESMKRNNNCVYTFLIGLSNDIDKIMWLKLKDLIFAANGSGKKRIIFKDSERQLSAKLYQHISNYFDVQDELTANDEGMTGPALSIPTYYICWPSTRVSWKTFPQQNV